MIKSKKPSQHTTCKHPRENICLYIYIYELMTQFSLPIFASAATQLLFKKIIIIKLINLRSRERGVKPVLDKPKQG
jgi:ABC-type sugar transport system permease subunit